MGITIFLALVIIAYPSYLLLRWGIIFLQVGKEEELPEVNLSGKLHEPPNNLKPYFVDTLLNKTLTPSGRSISSTLLELVRIGFIRILYKDKITPSGARKRRYYLEFNEKKAGEIINLPRIEQRLLAFIFQGVGNVATFSEIKTYGIRKASVTRKFWKYWKDEVVYELVKMGFIDEDSYFTEGFFRKELVAVFSVITFTLYLDLQLASDYTIGSNNTPLIVLTIFFVAMIITFIILKFLKMYMYKRTDKGREEYARWLAFKNWLEAYSVTKNYPIDSLVLWEKYLIYGLAFGVSKKALSELQVNYSISDLGGSSLGEIVLLKGSVEGDYDISSLFSEIAEFSSLVTGIYSGVEKEEKEIISGNKQIE